MSANLSARRVVENHDAEDLLPMLGLVTEDGDTPPDDNNVYSLFDPSTYTEGRGSFDPITKRTARPEELTAPEALVNPVQPPKKPRPKSPPKPPRPPRPVPECGTYKKVSWHKRNGTKVGDMDTACQDVARAYGREKAAEYAAAKKRAS